MHEQNGVHPHNDYYLAIKRMSSFPFIIATIIFTFKTLPKCVLTTWFCRNFQGVCIDCECICTMAHYGAQRATSASTWDRVSLFPNTAYSRPAGLQISQDSLVSTSRLTEATVGWEAGLMHTTTLAVQGLWGFKLGSSSLHTSALPTELIWQKLCFAFETGSNCVDLVGLELAM